MNIYQITQSLKDIEEIIEAAGGEITPEIETSLSALYQRKEDKIQAYHSLLKRASAELLVVAAELKHFTALKKRAERKIEELTRLAEFAIPVGEEWNHNASRFWYSPSEGIDIAEGTILPQEYVREKISREPDKVGLTKAIKSGEEIEGVTLKKRFTLKFQ